MYWDPTLLLPLDEQVRIFGEVNIADIVSPKVQPKDEEGRPAEVVLLPKPGESAQIGEKK